MLFNQLSSELIKSGIISRLNFSLAFKVINSQIQARKEVALNELDFELGTKATVKQEASEKARRNYSEFKAFCESYDYAIDSLEVVAQAYVKGTGKPATKVNAEVMNLRAMVSGKSIAGINAVADKQRAIAIAKAEEQVKSIVAEFQDLDSYANEFYNHCHIDDFGGLASSSVEIKDIITDEFVSETYPKIVKSQCDYWNKYGNWDDAELVLIAADQKLIA